MSSEVYARAVDPLSQYLEEIGGYPVLEKQEEVDLAQIIEMGELAKAQLADGPSQELNAELLQQVEEGRCARMRFISCNLRLVVSVAKKYPQVAGVEMLDLIQEGNLGLEHAVTKFDWRKGFKFSTYATFWIQQAITRYLDQKTTMIRLPGDKASAVRRAVREHGEDSAELPDRFKELYKVSRAVSLNSLLDDGETELGDFITGASDPAKDAIDGVVSSRILNNLSGLERRALELRFGFVDGEETSYREIGEILGLTTEQARRLVIKTVTRLSVEYSADELRLAN
jgi:RNA polymerase primary sigma factor